MSALEAHQYRENYLKIQAVTGVLQRRYEYGRDYLVKTPEPMERDRTYRYVHDKNDLCGAMTAVLERVRHQLPPPARAFEGIVGREPYPVSDKARAIVEQLQHYGVARFRALLGSSRSRSEVVATFLAILELCKTNAITLEDDTSGENPNVRLLDRNVAEGVQG